MALAEVIPGLVPLTRENFALEGGAAFTLGVAAAAVHDHSPFFVLVRSPDLGVVDCPPASVPAKAG